VVHIGGGMATSTAKIVQKVIQKSISVTEIMENIFQG
jgi:hypothetical protein